MISRKGGYIDNIFPEEIEVPDVIVQQIQISHNFTESYIVTQTEEWKSVSIYNTELEYVIVVALDDTEDEQIFKELLTHFDKELREGISRKEMSKWLENFYVFCQEKGRKYSIFMIMPFSPPELTQIYRKYSILDQIFTLSKEIIIFPYRNLLKTDNEI